MTTSLRAAQAAVPAAPVTPGFGSVQAFEGLQRIANMFNRSSLVPKDFRGQEHFGNTVIALDMALRLGVNPLIVFQNLYIIQEKPAWSSQFLIATFNLSGKYSSLRFEFDGQQGTESYGCRAVATELATGEKLSGTFISLGMARREGWLNNAVSKWQTMPDQMLRYRAAAFFIRAIAPEIAMGLRTVEEEREILDAEQHSRRPRGTTAAALSSVSVSELPAPEPDIKLIQDKAPAAGYGVYSDPGTGEVTEVATDEDEEEQERI